MLLNDGPVYGVTFCASGLSRGAVGTRVLAQLLRWAFFIAIRTEDAAISRAWFQSGLAAQALIEKEASVSRHFFLPLKAAVRTRYC
jgi:hypothetical protein